MDITKFTELLEDYKSTLDSEDKNIKRLEENIGDLEWWLNFSISDFKKIEPIVTDLIMKTELNFFINCDENNIKDIYKKLIFVMLKYKAKNREQWIMDYLFYIENDSFDYYKYYLLDKIRSSRTVQELRNKDSEISKYINEWKEICSEEEFKWFRPIILEYLDIIFSDIRYSFLSNDEKIRNNEYFFNNSALNPLFWIFNIRFSDYVPNNENVEISNEDIDKENEECLNNTNVTTVETEVTPELDLNCDRSKYRIWLIFWSPKSVKDFHRWCRKDSWKEVLDTWWIKEEQFDILNEEFETQQRMDIASRLYNSIDFIIVFELDHKTDFMDNVVSNPEFQHRITINNVPWQHFSIKRIKDLLKTSIDRYELVEKN